MVLHCIRFYRHRMCHCYQVYILLDKRIWILQGCFYTFRVVDINPSVHDIYMKIWTIFSLISGNHSWTSGYFWLFLYLPAAPHIRQCRDNDVPVGWILLDRHIHNFQECSNIHIHNCLFLRGMVKKTYSLETREKEFNNSMAIRYRINITCCMMERKFTFAHTFVDVNTCTPTA